MDLVCVHTVPADGITALSIQGRMIELYVCVCVCCVKGGYTGISEDMEADT